jgi:epoxyqueuosine reductase
MDPQERTRWVVAHARELGFDLCGVAPAADFPELARLPEWLERGHAGEMHYLHDPRRQSPARVLEGARSIVVCALNYNTSLPYSTEVPVSANRIVGLGFSPGKSASPRIRALAPEDERGPRGWLSRYAWGDDYHDVLGEKLAALLAAMREKFPEPFEARAYVDTGPVVERVAARHAGLGWLAKNTCLINEELGSWLFLGVIVTSLEFAPSLGPAESLPADLCGNCTLCLEACPTGAILVPYLLDARRCISYLTIELPAPVPDELRPAMGRHVFGCDICQDVCPWNRRAPTTPLAAFQPRAVESRISRPPTGGQAKLENRQAAAGALHAPAVSQSLAPETGHATAQIAELPPHNQSALFADSADSLFLPSLEWLASLTPDDFRRVFRSSAVKRTKWQGLVRNACLALGNACSVGLQAGTVPHARVVALLQKLARLDDPVIADAAQWALHQRSGSK